MEYAVIGDGVNLASRLESACKEYRAHILVSENTVNKLKGTYRLREMDLIQVKGKTKPVSIYELLDYHTDDSFPNMRPALQAFQDGLNTYRECKFDQAAKLFTDALHHNPNDGSAKMFIERCAYLKDHHPGDNWDGVWVMKSK
jgi:adenylate cyclase